MAGQLERGGHALLRVPPPPCRLTIPTIPPCDSDDYDESGVSVTGGGTAVGCAASVSSWACASPRCASSANLLSGRERIGKFHQNGAQPVS